jgi:hypothetical protein
MKFSIPHLGYTKTRDRAALVIMKKKGKSI